MDKIDRKIPCSHRNITKTLHWWNYSPTRTQTAHLGNCSDCGRCNSSWCPYCPSSWCYRNGTGRHGSWCHVEASGLQGWVVAIPSCASLWFALNDCRGLICVSDTFSGCLPHEMGKGCLVESLPSPIFHFGICYWKYFMKKSVWELDPPKFVLCFGEGSKGLCFSRFSKRSLQGMRLLNWIAVVFFFSFWASLNLMKAPIFIKSESVLMCEMSTLHQHAFGELGLLMCMDCVLSINTNHQKRF